MCYCVLLAAIAFFQRVLYMCIYLLLSMNLICHSPSYVFIFTYLLTHFSNILFKFYL